MRKSPRTKTRSPEAHAFLDGILPIIVSTEDIDKIEDLSERIMSEVGSRRAKYAEAIESAKEGVEKARNDQENAETEEEFDAALDRLQRNEGKLRFNEHKLQEFDHTPRMTEEEYNEKLDLIHQSIEDGAAEFQRTVLKASAEIIKARDEYYSLMIRADEVLEKLDSASNILQSKFAYKTYDFVNSSSIKVEDPSEWRRHITRYSNGAGYVLATASDDLDREERKQLSTFWRAAEKATR